MINFKEDKVVKKKKQLGILEKSKDYFFDIGPIAITFLIFGCMVFIKANFTEYPLHIVFGFIAICYGLIRIQAVKDKDDILRALNELNKEE